MLRPVAQAPDRAGVYLLYKEGRVVYVGQTKSLCARLGDLDPRQAESYLLLPVRSRRLVERALIRALQPAGNSQCCRTPAKIRVYDGHRKNGSRVNVRLDRDLARMLRERAAEEGRTTSGMVRWLLDREVKRRLEALEARKR